MNIHRGSDFNDFLIEQGLSNTYQPMTPTPITDAAEILWNDTGWCVVPAELARQLECEIADKAESLAFQTQLNREVIEREKQTFANLASERALADRLADALENAVSWDYAKPAFDAWKEARRGAR